MAATDRFHGRRHRTVRTASRALAMTAWPEPDVLINMQMLGFGAFPEPLARFSSPFQLTVPYTFWTEADSTYWTSPPHNPATHPIEAVGFALDIVNEVGNFITFPIDIEARILISQSPSGPFQPWHDWQPVNGQNALLLYGSQFDRDYFGHQNIPWPNGVAPHGYVRMEIRGQYTAYPGQIQIRWIYFNVTRRYRESEV